MTSVPRVGVYDHNDASAVSSEVQLPGVFTTPIRSDVVQFVHTNLSKNSRQARGVDPLAGMRHAAISWGPGRAVARIPRVTGSGSQRTGQAAFGNMTRKGRMFAPLKTWRRWHRKVNLKQRRLAVASALAASVVTPLVMSRGHRVDNLPSLPLVLEDSWQDVDKTSGAVQVLKRFGLWDDVMRCKNSKVLRPGRGKARNRRYTMRRGPLFVVHDRNCKVALALRNLAGVDVAVASALDLRQLAPGAHLGRLVVWTKTAFLSVEDRNNTRSCLSNADIQRIINSNEVQSVVNDVKRPHVLHNKQKKNPLRNRHMMRALNPHSSAQRKNQNAQ